MAAQGKTDKELWSALAGLDDDLLDLDLPEALVDEELKAIGVDPSDLAKRTAEFIAKAKDEERLAWKTRAEQRRAQLEALASKAASKLPVMMDRNEILARLDALRAAPEIGSAIKMAARKRKPEESSDDELRTLLEEMEALRTIDRDESES